MSPLYAGMGKAAREDTKVRAGAGSISAGQVHQNQALMLADRAAAGLLDPLRAACLPNAWLA